MCGEPGSVDLLKKMCETTGESVEVFVQIVLYTLNYILENK